MRKIKFAIASVLGVIAIVMAFALGARVNAEPENMTYGTVETVVNGGTGEVTKTWRFTSNLPSGSNYNLTDGDLSGITKASGGTVSIKKDGSGFSIANGAKINIAVPAGISTVTFGYANGQTFNEDSSKKRYINLNTDSIDYVSGTSLLGNTAGTEKSVSVTNNKITAIACGGEIKASSIWIKYTPVDTVTISYEENGGSAVDDQIIAKGNKTTAPVTTKSGYRFLGWFESDNDGVTLYDTAFDFENTTINDNLVLYADWEEATSYTVSFNSKGGSSIVSQSVVEGEKAIEPSTPYLFGFTFAGWYTSTDGGNTLSSLFDFDNTTINSTITLYAKWSNQVIKDFTFDSYPGFSSLPGEKAATVDVVLNGYITIDQARYNKPNSGTKQFDNSISLSNYVQNGEFEITLSKTTLVTFFATQTNDSNARDLVIKKTSNSEVCGSYRPTKNDNKYNTYSILLEAGSYSCICYDGDNQTGLLNLFGVTFDEMDGVKALQQEAQDGDYIWVRFIFIIRGTKELSSSDFANKLTLILDDGEVGQKTLTRSPKAYNKIVQGESTYSATVEGKTYEFDHDKKAYDIYVVYVVKFTKASYSGHNIKASLNYNDTDYKTSGYTFA